MSDKSKDSFVNQTVPFGDVKNWLTSHSVSSAICRVMDVFNVGSSHRRDNLISEAKNTFLVCRYECCCWCSRTAGV